MGTESVKTAAGSKTEQYLIIEQVVEALVDSESTPLGELLENAREVEDPVAMANLLAGHIEQHRDDCGALEALTLLCLAHVKLARKVGFKLIPEGRRLAGLLQVEGHNRRAQEVLEALSQRAPRDRRVEKELAAVMRRTGNVERLVERYLERAEEAQAAGRRRDAITWLREVLLLDRSRRDVARMIRDLQYETRHNRDVLRRRLRSAGIVLVLIGVVAGLIGRELHVQRQFSALEPAEQGELDSLQLRLGGLDRLISANPLWIGMFEAGRERAELRAEIERLHARQAEQDRKQAARRAERLIRADSSQVRARQLLESRDYAGAIEQYEQALRAAPADWSQRKRVEADLTAVKQHQEELSR